MAPTDGGERAAHPLSLAGDDAAVQVLRLVRSLLVQADRQSVSDDGVTRMSTVLSAQTAIETLLRCVWERLSDKSKDNAAIGDIESRVYGELKPLGLRGRDHVKALRTCRNLVAHHGSIPSSPDVQRHTTAARKFACDVVSVAFGADLEKLRRTNLVECRRWRRWLESAYGLLDDKEFELRDDAGNVVPASALGQSSTIATTLAHQVWVESNASVLWPAVAKAPELYPHLDHSQHEQQELQDNFQEREHALRSDVLALNLGVRQADVLRFLKAKGAGLTFSPSGSWTLRFEGTSSPSEAEARFAVDFATDWVLRAQQHIR